VFTVKTGTIAFDFVGSGGALTIQLGAIDATLTAVGQDTTTLSATLSGSLDCATGDFRGTLTGHVDVGNFLPIVIAGTWEGSMDGAGALSGSWTEIESVFAGTPDAGVCIPGGSLLTEPVGTGCGTWNAQP
jgi:hypothetical protein